MLQSVECWGICEVALAGPSDGNPFVDVQLSAELTYKNRHLYVDGFYDGTGIYRLRFMPDTVGTWRYVTRSNVPELGGQTGEFTCVAPEAGNHGPVGVRDTYHFVYADGTPHLRVEQRVLPAGPTIPDMLANDRCACCQHRSRRSIRWNFPPTAESDVRTRSGGFPPVCVP